MDRGDLPGDTNLAEGANDLKTEEPTTNYVSATAVAPNYFEVDGYLFDGNIIETYAAFWVNGTRVRAETTTP